MITAKNTSPILPYYHFVLLRKKGRPDVDIIQRITDTN